MIYLHVEAQAQLDEIAAYLEERRKGLGHIFIEELFEVIGHLERYPQAQEIKRKDYRQIMIGRFRYMIIYALSGKDVHIYNIIHTSRDPEKRYRKKSR